MERAHLKSAAQAEWEGRFLSYASAYPALAEEFERRVRERALPADWPAASAQALAKVVASRPGIASRKASQNAIDALLPLLPELIGGSADLSGSNLTEGKTSVAVRRTQPGNHVNYGVREFGMSAIMNGLALHSGYIPYGGTFLTFSDYSRNAVRMSALAIGELLRAHFADLPGRVECGELAVREEARGLLLPTAIWARWVRD